MQYQAISVSQEFNGVMLRSTPYYLTKEVDESVNRLASKGWDVVSMTSTLVKEKLVRTILFGKDERKTRVKK